MSEGADEISSLIRLARDGSRSRLGELLESFRPLLQRLAEHKVGHRLRTRLSQSDIVQETMLTASQGFATFRGRSEQELRRWLVQIFHARLNDGLRRHVLAERRRRSKDRAGLSALVADPQASPSEIAQINEHTRLLVDALLELDCIDRQIVLMRYTEHKSFESIAQAVDLPLSNVWRRWSHAIEVLRQRLVK